MNHCQKCGYNLNEYDKFCQNCGAKIEIPIQENSFPIQEKPVNTGEQYQQSNAYTPDIKSKSSNKTFLLLGIFIILFIFLVGGGVTAYFLFIRDSDETAENIKKNETKEKTGFDKSLSDQDRKKKNESSETEDHKERKNENSDKKQINDIGDCGDYTELSERKISPQELAEMPKSELRIMRNEIFMRHGLKFKSKDLQDHFSQYDCYQPLYDDVTQYLTEIEKYNLDLIKKYEK